MIQLKRITLDELKGYIALSYKGDFDLLNEFHMQKCDTEEEAVRITYKEICDVAEVYETRFYKVMYGNDPIGFVVEFDTCLFSFGLAMEYRHPDITSEFYNQIDRLMNGSFWVGLYKNNTRAIKFLVKQGMRVNEVPENPNAVVLTNV